MNLVEKMAGRPNKYKYNPDWAHGDASNQGHDWAEHIFKDEGKGDL